LRQNSTFSQYIKKLDKDITPQPRNAKYKINEIKLNEMMVKIRIITKIKNKKNFIQLEKKIRTYPDH